MYEDGIDSFMTMLWFTLDGDFYVHGLPEKQLYNGYQRYDAKDFADDVAVQCMGNSRTIEAARKLQQDIGDASVYFLEYHTGSVLPAFNDVLAKIEESRAE